MITLIAGTARIGSNTKKIALEYARLLKEKGVEVNFLSLDEHNVYERNEAFIEMEKKYLIPTRKFIIILPEYNGSYSGILKLMIDNSDVAHCWHRKKVLLTGVSTGRAGNLRGMEHLTGVLLYLKMHVHHNRLPISTVDKVLDQHNQIHDPITLQAIDHQLDEFLSE